jgi:hypothetical protein
MEPVVQKFGIFKLIRQRLMYSALESGLRNALG